MIFDNIRMKPKLLFLFIMTGIVPLGIVALIGSYSASNALLDLAFEQLGSIQAIKRDKLQTTLTERISGLKLLAGLRQTQQAVGDLNVLGEDDPARPYPIESSEYQRIHGRYDSQLKGYIAVNGFEDLYLIDRRGGNVMYAAGQGEELGTSLATGRYRHTALARLWERVLRSGDVAFEDFSVYEPNGGKQAAFIGYPVLDLQGGVAGVIAARVSGEFINQIMPSRQGLGKSGESYLLRWLESQKKFEMRSDIKTMGNGLYVIGYTLPRTPAYWHDAVVKGFDGGGGTYEDSAGTTVLVAFNTLDVLGTNWILISKIDKGEILRPIWTFLLIICVTGAVLALMIAPGAYGLAKGISQPLEQGVSFAEAISAGDLKARLDLRQKDELGMLAKALNSMARNLREMDWLNQGKTGLDDTLRGEHSPQELARLFISFICKHLDSQIGLFFLHDDGELVLTSSYAFTNRQGQFTRLRVGEGLVGQAALEGEILTFAQVEEGAPHFHFGPGEAVPSHFLAAPVFMGKELLGAFLIGREYAFSPLHRQFIADIAKNTAVLFNMATSRGVIADLLRQAQEQQEMLRVANEELEEQTNMLKESQTELQAQQEELQVTNEELAEQTRALKESERRLQDQQGELRSVNDKLGERAMELEEQKSAIRRKNKELLRAQEQLKLKAQELESASRYKSEFLANMSHELRTPLNSILILSQLLAHNKEGNLSPKQTEAASAINSSGADLLRLINEILDLSKVEAGKVELHLEEMPLTSMISDLQRVFKGVAVEKGVSFLVEQDPSLPETMLTDTHRLQQVLRNLLSNAFKFTDHGSVTLSISRPDPEIALPESIPSAEEAICIAVTDMGIGIPEDKQGTIFEAFRQADGSTSRKYGGTGLGLSISRELTKLLGGEIRLHSREGQGSTFSLILPLRHHAGTSVDETRPRESAPEQKATPPRPAKPEVEAPAPYLQDDRANLKSGDKSLLIIEDDQHFARILRDQARDMGFKVLLAADGETGLHFADFHAPSAIILDNVLPGIDGWTVMERLKNDPGTRHIPLSFISAEDRSLEAMRMGALAFLTKPVKIEELQKLLEKIDTFIKKPSRRLLVVDDDALQRESIRALIGNGDVETVTAASGAQALALLKSQNFDCMILDLGLSDMSGFDVLRTLRSGPTPSTLPVVVYTGRDLSDEEERRLSQYAESIIVKGARSPERLLEETTLFLHRVQANLPQEKQRMLQTDSEPESVLYARTVLVVDDDMRNIFALTSVLEEKGMQVVVARDGSESLTKLRENPEIDLVLMDIMMPVMDGYEAMREIRKDPRLKDLPIIALTAKAMKGDKSACIEAGANDYLAKPVDMDKLLSLLRVWLYRK
ncbi:tubulin-specific chaperone A [Desulfomicrobium macestii]|uniref:histidine kinase n=1 Tax=Desulfomicrobium macestii TaxID=90731 RepID=A0ABR9GYW0_9BACT|nr:response regulator [Desulfomicrobium macestii]MBE1423645.1 tubulin-specific chaperone A [Desulfomicrobium macestii]